MITIFGSLFLFVLLIYSNQINGPLCLWQCFIFPVLSSKTKFNSQSYVNLSRILSILEVAEMSYF